MKKLLLLVGMGCLLLVGCDSPYKQEVKMFEGKHDFNYTITIIDKCEYITFPGPEGAIQLCHKGNCTNCQSIFRAWYAENK